MTDDEIMIALRRCADNACCLCAREGKTCRRESIASIAWNVMCDQKVEIERLWSMNQAKLDMIHDLNGELETAKAEAVKEFAEEVKTLNNENLILWNEQIDNLVKKWWMNKK